MVKLTADLILQSMQFINAYKDRELDLRGYKIPVIENLGATLPLKLPKFIVSLIGKDSPIGDQVLQCKTDTSDQFDCIDFSENDVRKLDGFPLLKRLNTLLLNGNRIVRIGDHLEESLPNLQMLILTNNHLQELADIDPLATLPKLTHLSLLHNPVSMKHRYREYVIFKLPNLKVLDFRKIKQKEREAASSLFKSKQGKELQKNISKTRTFVPGEEIAKAPTPARSLPATEVRAIKEAIAKASSLEEIERLNQMLRSGQVPGRPATNGASKAVNDGEEMET